MRRTNPFSFLYWSPKRRTSTSSVSSLCTCALIASLMCFHSKLKCHLLKILLPWPFCMIIHPPHLNDTHSNSYSVPSCSRPILEIAPELLLTPLWKNPLWFVAALVKSLVPWCAWLLSSSLEIVRLRLRNKKPCYCGFDLVRAGKNLRNRKIFLGFQIF